jgi:hypothetical protein
VVRGFKRILDIGQDTSYPAAVVDILVDIRIELID